jgi:lipopolysaccharide/colanic/teichoic acid biosynthesis glycosyltransferase
MFLVPPFPVNRPNPSESETENIEEAVNLRASSESLNRGRCDGRTGPTEGHAILSEEAFHRVISLERRRTERSGKPFLLMLLDIGDEQPSETNWRTLEQILASLAGAARATDVIGWYKNDCVAGVMLTEIGLTDRKSIPNALVARLSDTLRQNLSAEEFRQVNISFHVFPEDWDQEERKRPSNPALYPDLSERANRRRLAGALKRMMDVAGSTAGLLIALPLFAAIAVAIKVTSKGPVFFRQRRIGQHGTSFVFLKFRSMYENNDSSTHKEYVRQLIAGTAERHPSDGNGEGVYKLTKDRRITRVGAFLRRTSLDELPQLINVLQGEMSLVGPRPPVPYEVEEYDIWHRRRLLEAKPGITGLWQVSGRSRVKFDDMVRLDLQYARSWSPWLDIKILLRTPAAVLFGEGAH